MRTIHKLGILGFTFAIGFGGVFTQKGSLNALRPLMGTWGFEQWNGTAWLSTEPENVLSNAASAISVNGQLVSNSAITPIAINDLTSKFYVDSTRSIGIKGKVRTSLVTPNLTIDPLFNVTTNTLSGLITVLHSSADTFDLTTTSAICSTCGATAISTRYYLYTYNSTDTTVGPLYYERNTTPPGNMINKPGDESRIYIINFATDATNTIVTQTSTNGKVLMASDQQIYFPLITSCDLLSSIFAPPQAKTYLLDIFAGCGATPGHIDVYSDSGCTIPICQKYATSLTLPNVGQCEVPAIPLYAQATASCLGGALISTIGFTE